MDQEQSQQEQSQRDLNYLKSTVDKVIENAKRDRQHLDKILQYLKVLEKEIYELKNPKQEDE